MDNWLFYTSIAIACWGAVGLLQKLGTNRISSQSLLCWVSIGFLVLVPFLWQGTAMLNISVQGLVIGLAGGLANGLGSWFLFRSLESGAKASVAIPMTALYPLLTLLLAFIFLGERLTSLEWVGVLAALIGGMLLSYEKENQSNAADVAHSAKTHAAE